MQFSSCDYPQDDAAQVYQLMFASAALVTPLVTPFHVDITSFWSEHLRFHFMDGVPFIFHRPAQKLGFDGLDAIILQHVETGSIIGNFDGRDVRTGAGSVYAIDFSRPAIIRDAQDIPQQRRNFVSMPRAFAAAGSAPWMRSTASSFRRTSLRPTPPTSYACVTACRIWPRSMPRPSPTPQP